MRNLQALVEEWRDRALVAEEERRLWRDRALRAERDDETHRNDAYHWRATAECRHKRAMEAFDRHEEAVKEIQALADKAERERDSTVEAKRKLHDAAEETEAELWNKIARERRAHQTVLESGQAILAAEQAEAKFQRERADRFHKKLENIASHKLHADTYDAIVSYARAALRPRDDEESPDDPTDAELEAEEKADAKAYADDIRTREL